MFTWAIFRSARAIFKRAIEGSFHALSALVVDVLSHVDLHKRDSYIDLLMQSFYSSPLPMD